MQKRPSGQIYSKKPAEPSSSELISNIAKSLLRNQGTGKQQTQGKPVNQTKQQGNSGETEIKNLLERISNQLDSMQQSSQFQSQQNSSNDSSGGANNKSVENNNDEQSGKTGDELVTQQLQSLFRQLLHNDQSSNMDQSEDQGNSLQNQETSGSQKQLSQNRMTAQTAAQALAEAQYELSTELEASLKKLKQVINESEKLANKISSLLGEENNKQG